MGHMSICMNLISRVDLPIHGVYFLSFVYCRIHPQNSIPGQSKRGHNLWWRRFLECRRGGISRIRWPPVKRKVLPREAPRRHADVRSTLKHSRKKEKKIYLYIHIFICLLFSYTIIIVLCTYIKWYIFFKIIQSFLWMDFTVSTPIAICNLKIYWMCSLCKKTPKNSIVPFSIIRRHNTLLCIIIPANSKDVPNPLKSATQY